jgi:lysophospholipase L1-like esterase
VHTASPSISPPLSTNTQPPSYKTVDSRSTCYDYLFLGDSLFEYWLCFKLTDQTSAVRDSIPTNECVSFLSTYLDDPLNLELSDCSTKSNWYCSSTFSSEFPGAINIAIRGTTIDYWQNSLEAVTDPSTKNVINLPYLRYIVIELGANNIRAGNNGLMIAEKYGALLEEVHRIFPYCKILVVSIPPCNYDTLLLLSTTISCPLLVEQANKNISALISDREKYPYAEFSDITDYFTSSGNLDDMLNWDSLHLSKLGYEMFAIGVKNSFHLISS